MNGATPLKLLSVFRTASIGMTHFCAFPCLLESCFQFSLTHRKPPLFCRQGYLKQQGVVRNGQVAEHANDAEGMAIELKSDPLQVQPLLPPNYLAQTGASVTPGLKLGF